jgi:hypothetical protein
MVTDANRGIGLALTVPLVENSLTLVLTARTARAESPPPCGNEAKHPGYAGCSPKPNNAEDIDGGSNTRGCSQCEGYASTCSLLSH